MNKKIFIILVLVVSLALTGCGKKEDKTTESAQTEKASEVIDERSILDWLKGGKTVECIVKSPEGEVVTTTKGESVRVEGVPYYSMDSNSDMPEATNGIMLTVGDWTYMWDKDTKKGTKMNLKEIEETYPEDDSDYEQPEDIDEMAEEWENSEYEYSCKDVSANDDLFQPPSDVEFVDFSAIMEGFNNMGNQMQEQMESGEDFDMEEIEKMMQEFQK